MPYGPKKLRAAKKEKKLYFWDWSLCDSQGARFENFIAAHLLKYCHYIEDTEGDKMELRFLRDASKREIDFVVIKNQSPLFAVECKSGESSLSQHIKYFSTRTPIPFYYQVHLGQRDYQVSGINARVLPVTTFCKELKL